MARDALRSRARGGRGDPFVFFDLETTGLNPRVNHIIEIAAIRFTPRGGALASFHALVRIDAPVPAFITALTGISSRMLRGQQPIEATLPRFVDFIEDLPLVAYNAPFDMGFLRAAASRLKMQLGNACDCALQAARRKLPDLPNHKLKTVAAHLGVGSDQRHRALDDCEMGLRVFSRLMAR